MSRLTTDMMGFMAESRYAAGIAYFLGKHEQRAAQRSAMSLPDAAAVSRDIESKVAQGEAE
jgi:hypothetical protein